LLHREGADDLAGLLRHRHRHDAFAAATRRAVLVGRGTLAVAPLRHRQHKLLRGGQFDIAFFAEFDSADRLLGIGARLLIGPAAAADGTGALEIGGPFFSRYIDVTQDRHRNHVILLGQRDAAHAARRAALEHAHLRYRETDAL